MKHLVIGSVPFRNVVFPYYFIEKNPGKFKDHIKFHSAFPPQLGELVLNNRVDIAPVSSIIYAMHPEFFILPDFSISAKKRTGSIVLISKKNFEEISSVCLPSNSATSIVMLKIIFKIKGINAKFKISNSIDEKCDAALFIGDDGIAARERFLNHAHKNVDVIDLGEEWNKITGKGMVYALWLINKKSAEEKYKEIKRFSELLSDSINYAYKNFEDVIDKIKGNLKRESVQFHISCLSYNFKKEQIDALLNFYEYAKRYGFISDVPRLNFLKI